MTEYFRDLAVVLDIDGGGAIWEETLQMAARHELTVYDASYLELAHRVSLPLATLDRRLRTAAAAIGVETLGM